MKKRIYFRLIIFILLIVFVGGCSSTEVYFCPRENCKDVVLDELKNSENSIYFMLYSFTDEDISNLLITKSNNNVEVKGIIEGQRINNLEERYDYLIKSNIKIKKDKNKYLMHNKVFIVDKKTVITGSANPSKNGYLRNNDNIVIIRDKKIAERYLEEFDKLY